MRTLCFYDVSCVDEEKCLEGFGASRSIKKLEGRWDREAMRELVCKTGRAGARVVPLASRVLVQTRTCDGGLQAGQVEIICVPAHRTQSPANVGRDLQAPATALIKSAKAMRSTFERVTNWIGLMALLLGTGDRPNDRQDASDTPAEGTMGRVTHARSRPHLARGLSCIHCNRKACTEKRKRHFEHMSWRGPREYALKRRRLTRSLPTRKLCASTKSES